MSYESEIVFWEPTDNDRFSEPAVQINANYLHAKYWFRKKMDISIFDK